ncbi:hypothetical protein Pelo_17650 [Pelomyxa schiedti]|nr:hypothetical protein Pelo_17650 [Pelomyxa schiedti]
MPGHKGKWSVAEHGTFLDVVAALSLQTVVDPTLEQAQLVARRFTGRSAKQIKEHWLYTIHKGGIPFEQEQVQDQDQEQEQEQDDYYGAATTTTTVVPAPAPVPVAVPRHNQLLLIFSLIFTQVAKTTMTQQHLEFKERIGAAADMHTLIKQEKVARTTAVARYSNQYHIEPNSMTVKTEVTLSLLDGEHLLAPLRPHFEFTLYFPSPVSLSGAQATVERIEEGHIVLMLWKQKASLDITPTKATS